MKLSKETIAILKSFSQINNSIYIDEVNYLKTKTANSTNVIAVAKIEEHLPDLAIYSLNEFVGSMTLFNKSDIEFIFDKDFITMAEDKIKIKYRLSDPSHILSHCKSAKDYEAYDSFDCSFNLDQEQLSSIKKAARILGADMFKVALKKGVGVITLLNSELPLSNSFEIEIEGTGAGEASFFVENMMLIDGDYTVSVTNNKVLKFDNNNYPLFYFISCAIVN
jgi:hypothetical protein